MIRVISCFFFIKIIHFQKKLKFEKDQWPKKYDDAFVKALVRLIGPEITDLEKSSVKYSKISINNK